MSLFYIGCPIEIKVFQISFFAKVFAKCDDRYKNNDDSQKLVKVTFSHRKVFFWKLLVV